MKKKFLAAVMALVMIGTTPVGVFADTMVKSYLTGLDVPESEGRVRPVAVMLNNIKQGCPQSGIANAGVVYEAPVEGDITRLMGIFEDYKDLEAAEIIISFMRMNLMQFMRIMDSLLLHFHILNSI